MRREMDAQCKAGTDSMAQIGEPHLSPGQLGSSRTEELIEQLVTKYHRVSSFVIAKWIKGKPV